MTTLTLQPDDTTGKDAFIYDNYPTTNYGTHVTLYVGDNAGATYRTLIQFDLSSIPVNAIIDSVTLSLTIKQDNSSNTRTLSVYRLKVSWDEATVTWNQRSTANAWTTAGGFSSVDCESTPIGELSLGAAETGTKSVSLSASAIQEMVDGTFTNNGFLLKTTAEANDRYGYRSSGDTPSTELPKLVVEYHLAGGTTFRAIIIG